MCARQIKDFSFLHMSHVRGTVPKEVASPLRRHAAAAAVASRGRGRVCTYGTKL